MVEQQLFLEPRWFEVGNIARERTRMMTFQPSGAQTGNSLIGIMSTEHDHADQSLAAAHTARGSGIFVCGLCGATSGNKETMGPRATFHSKKIVLWVFRREYGVLYPGVAF